MNKFECHMCGDQIGDGCKKNVVHLCDAPRNANKQWCGKCFANTPCGYGKHGAGCLTQMLCEAA